MPRTLQRDSTDSPSIRSIRNRTGAILRDLFGPPASRRFAVRYWDSSTEAPGIPGPPPFTIVLNHPGSLAKMLLPPSLVFIVLLPLPRTYKEKFSRNGV